MDMLSVRCIGRSLIVGDILSLGPLSSSTFPARSEGFTIVGGISSIATGFVCLFVGWLVGSFVDWFVGCFVLFVCSFVCLLLLFVCLFIYFCLFLCFFNPTI